MLRQLLDLLGIPFLFLRPPQSLFRSQVVQIGLPHRLRLCNRVIDAGGHPVLVSTYPRRPGPMFGSSRLHLWQQNT